MSVFLNKPYKIVEFKQERYDAHYNIPSSASLVVPTKYVGDELLCDVRWENENGELKVLHERMFIKDNLVRIDPTTDKLLFEMWDNYYNQSILN